MDGLYQDQARERDEEGDRGEGGPTRLAHGRHHEGEAGVNSLMVQRADRVVVVATGPKLGARSFARICPANRIDLVVTDDTADPAAIADLRAAGVDVEVV